MSAPIYESVPGNIRFILGPTAPITTGWSTDASGDNVQHVISYVSGEIRRFDFSVLAGGQEPSGGPLVVDFQVSRDQGVTWNSCFPSGISTMPTLPANAPFASSLSTGAAVFSHNDFVRAFVVQVGSVNPGMNIELKCFGYWEQD